MVWYRLGVAVGVNSAVKVVSAVVKIICIGSDLGKRGAPSGTRTPNPLIKRQFPSVFGCLTTSLTCCDVFASVRQRVPKSGIVGVSRRCQTPVSRGFSFVGVRRRPLRSPVSRRLSASVADTLWLSGSRPASPPNRILQCASGSAVHQDLGGRHVGR